MLLTKKQKQSGSSQKGITVGVITATMVAALAVGGLWSRMNTQSESMAASKAYQANAAINLMLAQAGQLQEAVEVAAENSNIAWTHVTNYNGKLSLANTTQAYITDFAVPSVRAPFIEPRNAGEFKGFSRAPDSTARLEWQFGAARDYGYLTAMAWLPVNNPNLCISINEKLGLGADFKLGYDYYELRKTTAEARVHLPVGHVAYTHLVNPEKTDKGVHLVEYQRLFRADRGSHISKVQLPLGRHRAMCMATHYSELPALIIILYHGPVPTS